MDEHNALVVFQGKEIRRIWHDNEWYFSVVDIIDALDASNRPRKYWSDLKTKLIEEGFEVSEKIGQLKLIAEDGKLRETDCANTKNMFRIHKKFCEMEPNNEIRGYVFFPEILKRTFCS